MTRRTSPTRSTTSPAPPPTAPRSSPSRNPVRARGRCRRPTTRQRRCATRRSSTTSTSSSPRKPRQPHPRRRLLRPGPRHHREKEKDQKPDHQKTPLGPSQPSGLTSTRMSQSLRYETRPDVPNVLMTDRRTASKRRVHIGNGGLYHHQRQFLRPALLCCIMEMGVDRILFSIDWPFVANAPGVEWLEGLSLSNEDKEKILNANAHAACSACSGYSSVTARGSAPAPAGCSGGTAPGSPTSESGPVLP